MGTKQVSQCSCDRCKRVWYEDPDQVKRQQSEVELSATLGDDHFEISFDCLCEGCASTVKGLLIAITRVMDKASPIRGAKKKGEAPAAGEVPATDAPTTKLAAPSKAVSVEPVTPAPQSEQAHAGIHVHVAAATKSSAPAPAQAVRQNPPPSNKS